MSIKGRDLVEFITENDAMDLEINVDIEKSEYYRKGLYEINNCPEIEGFTPADGKFEHIIVLS